MAPSKSLNQGLGAAKAAKQDEFYTQYVDIQKEVEAYLEFDPHTFRGKVVYCNCDDPFESNFFKYFAANFNKLGLKKLITTSYDGSPIAGQLTLFPEYNEGNGKRQKPKALAVILDHVKDEDGDGAANIDDVKLFLKRNKAARIALKGDDNYPGGRLPQPRVHRAPETGGHRRHQPALLPLPRIRGPASGARQEVSDHREQERDHLQGDIPPHQGKQWMGVTAFSGGMWFVADYTGKYEKVVDGVKLINVPAIWFTNLDHGRRHQKLPLMTMEENLRFSKHKEIKGRAAYDRYANYDAIEVPFTDAIPSDYDGAMGVPITFLDKYSPDQFEILGSSMALGVPMSQVAKKGSYLQGGPRFYIDKGDGSYRRMYDRIVIRRRAQPAKGRTK
jgi:hypothetical protein